MIIQDELESADLDDRFGRLYLAISDISKHLHKLTTDVMLSYELNGAHVMYLIALYRFPNGISASQIGRICRRDKSDVSRMMAIMVEKGFVQKEKQNQKQHCTIFKLTNKGFIAAKYAHQKANCIARLAEANLSYEKRATLYEALDLLISNLHEYKASDISKQ